MSQGRLPPGFEALAPFVDDWILDNAAARMAKRQSSSMAEIRAFYDAIVPLGVAALDHLRQYRLGELPAETENLLKLMLALAEIGPAVEWFDDPAVYDGFPIERIRYVRQISDSAAQW
jgi:hypothetical protein